MALLASHYDYFVLTSHQRRFVALLAAMGAAGTQVAAGFQGDPTNAQAAWFGLTVILTGIAGGLVGPDLKKKLTEDHPTSLLSGTCVAPSASAPVTVLMPFRSATYARARFTSSAVKPSRAARIVLMAASSRSSSCA